MPISTGYIPEFALGALYQGMNASNANAQSQEDVLRAFLANQREQNTQPLDQIIKTWDATKAQGQLNDPDYLPALLEGYKGQMNSQIAAGKKAMGTVDSDIDTINQDNRNKLFMGKTLEEWNKLRMADEDTPQSSVDTIEHIPNQWGGEGLQKGSNISWSGPNPPTSLHDFKGWRSGPLGDISKQSDMVKSFGVESDSNIPQQSQNNLLNKFKRILIDTPEHLQKMELQKMLADNRLEINAGRNQSLIEAAKVRASQMTKDPKLQSVLANALLIVSGSIESTPEQLEAAKKLLEVNTRRVAIEKSAAVQPGIDLSQTQDTGKYTQQTTPYSRFAQNPSSLFNESRRQQILGEKKAAQEEKDIKNGVIAKGNTSSGKEFIIREKK